MFKYVIAIAALAMGYNIVPILLYLILSTMWEMQDKIK